MELLSQWFSEVDTQIFDNSNDDSNKNNKKPHTQRKRIHLIGQNDEHSFF